MIEVTCVWRVQRALVFDRVDNGLPRDDVLLREIDIEARDARTMRQRMPDRDGLLTKLREGWPVHGHRRVEIEPAMLGKWRGADREHALGDGEDDRRGVRFVRL